MSEIQPSVCALDLHVHIYIDSCTGRDGEELPAEDDLIFREIQDRNVRVRDKLELTCMGKRQRVFQTLGHSLL